MYLQNIIHMDKYPNYSVPKMQSDKKSRVCNIYINPSFREPKKSVIHINPNVQLNVPVHVNPKMVNALSSSGQQRQELFMIQKNLLVTNSNILKPCIQKSVHVNPKLMQKLSSKQHDVPEINKAVVNKQQAVIQQPSTPVTIVRIKTKTKIINNNISNNNNKCSNVTNAKKNSPSKLISISNRKLVRIRPTTKLQQPHIHDRIVKKVKPHKLINVEQSEKFILKNQRIKYKVVNCVKSNNISTSSSTNKYKIDRTNVYASKAGTPKVQKVLKKKIVKIRVSQCKKINKRTNTNLINIDGVLYKSSKSQLVKSVPVVGDQANNLRKANTINTLRKSLNNSRNKNIYKKIKSDGKVRKLKYSTSKLNISKTLISSSLAQKSNYKHVLSNRVKQKSIQILRQKMSKNNQPCLLYQRFGFCAKFVEGICPKVHDKKQIALCKNFLQGKCLHDNCPLSHEVGPEKMPTCKYFLDGCCVRDSCQYLHVKVSANTPICIPFLRGYCEKGSKCKERHTNICPEFEKTGKCSKGKNCTYPHKTFVLAKRKFKPNVTTFNKQTIVNNSEKSHSLLPCLDENKKRYYDDDNLDNNISAKKTDILNQINTVKLFHVNSEQSNAIVQDSSDINNLQHQHPNESSQPDNRVIVSRRQPIGPLPAYIPIE